MHVYDAKSPTKYAVIRKLSRRNKKAKYSYYITPFDSANKHYISNTHIAHSTCPK